MKKHLSILAVCALLVVSCSDDPIGTTFAEDNYQPKGALISGANPDGCFLTDPSVSTLTIDVEAEGSESVSNADVIATYNGGAEGIITSVVPPAQAVLEMPNILSTLGITNIEAGDVISIGFDANTNSGTYRSSNVLNFNVGCASSIGGDHTYVATNLVAANSASACPTGEVTGTVSFIDLGCGVYGASDLGFGQYESSCWSDSPATDGGVAFTDICGVINVVGLDQYGLEYTWKITKVEGPEMFISWSNNYADSGDAVVTREGGLDWPALTTN